MRRGRLEREYLKLEALGKTIHGLVLRKKLQEWLSHGLLHTTFPA